MASASCLVDVVTAPCPNANVLGAQVFKEANEQGIDPATSALIPSVSGLAQSTRWPDSGWSLGGSAVVSAPINGAQRSPDGASMDFAPDANLFLNLRSQMAWQLREDFRKGDIAINPALQRVFTQLTAPRFEKRGGKVVIEEKKEIRKRLGHSPDDFDSIMYWNWVRPRSPRSDRHGVRRRPAPRLRPEEARTTPQN
jgi:hypothetical protein